MVVNFVLFLIAVIVMAGLGYFMGSRGKHEFVETINKLEGNIAELSNKNTTLIAERDVQKANAENLSHQLDVQKESFEQSLKKQEVIIAEFKQTEAQRNDDMKRSYEQQISELKASFEKQLHQMKEAHDNQIASLKQMNKVQLDSQLDLIKEQCRPHLKKF